jgi:TfoX/Sxy family transcriptional regulator of competence genes
MTMKMEWQKAPAAMVDLFALVAPGAPAERRTMFGYPCAFVHGNMFLGLFEDRMMLRLGESDRVAFLGLAGARTFEPMPGRPMREYVEVPGALLADRAALARWIAKSLAYASALPVRTRRPPKAAARKASKGKSARKAASRKSRPRAR